MTYTILDAIPDSPAWYEARRGGLGASDSAAVLGLSKWATPLQTYHSKLGVEREFDPMLAWVGHNLEPVIDKWVTEFRPDLGRTEPGFAARWDENPWLFATPDRVVSLDGEEEDLRRSVLNMVASEHFFPERCVPVEFKSSMEFARDNWTDKDGNRAVPLYYQVQSQQQQAVLDAPYGIVVVFHGGRDFEVFIVPRDDDFIEQLVRITGEWWEAHVVALTPPDPSTYAEALDAYPGVDGEVYELSQAEFENLEQRDVDASDMNHLKKRVEAVKEYIAPAVGNATVLTFEGRPAYTYKRQNGNPQVDLELLKEKWPKAYAAVVTPNRFPVLRKIKQEAKNGE